MKLVVLVFALASWGCVSTSRHKADMDALRLDVKQAESKLTKTQLVVCAQGMQLCAFTLALQAVSAGKSIEAEDIQVACIEQARQCTTTLADPKEAR